MKFTSAIEQVVAHIEANLTEELVVAEIAKIAGLSSWHFQRIFHDAMGETIGSYIRRRRLASAIVDLTASELRVIDVAFKYTFESSEAFSRAFKSEFGMSPLSFRKNPKLILPQRKPKLEERQIQFIVNKLSLTPEFRKVEPFKVIGLWASIASPFTQRHQYMERITKVWHDFVAREEEIPGRLGKYKVGVIDGLTISKSHIHEDRLDYLAGTATEPSTQPPEGMHQVEISGGNYAVFKAVGYHLQTQYIIDYVYSTWLPQSNFERSNAIEFTWVDHIEQALNPETTVVEYFFPIN